MEELGAEALGGRLKIAPHRVTTNSEPLLDETRDAVRKAWGVEINNMWGCVEVGHIGIECDAHQGMHMTDDLIITEFVDDHDQPTHDPDAISRVLVTSLFGRTLPLIRYELTDIPVPGDRSCSCGAKYPLIAGVKGRADDIFDYAGGVSIHPIIFRTPLGQNPSIAEYQVYQMEDGAKVCVVASGPVDVPSLRLELVAGLAKAGLRQPADRDRSGRQPATPKRDRQVEALHPTETASASTMRVRGPRGGVLIAALNARR